MYLIERFAPQAEIDGAFIEEMDCTEFFKGANLGAERGKKNFMFHAKRACHELGITVGYRETPTGFTLGFDSKADHERFVTIIEPQMRADAERAQRHTERLVAAYGHAGTREVERSSDRQTAYDQLSSTERAIFRDMQRAQEQGREARSRDDDWHHER